MVQDLQGKMSQWLLRTLDQLARVRLGKGNTKVLSNGLSDRLGRRVKSIMVMGVASVGVHVADKAS
jgi:hypothetical protein